jgi:hypothetical protein
MNQDTGQEPLNRKLAAGLGLLTSLVLLCAAGFLVSELGARFGVEPPTAAAPSVPAAARAGASAETPWMAFLAKTILTVTIILAMAIVAPMVGALCLFVLLRRYAKHLGPLLHVEQTRPTLVLAGAGAAASLGVAPVTAPTAQLLNLGPSFEEERLRQAGLAGRMEAGVLGQLFEDNVKLQQKIAVAREQEGATAPGRRR